MFAWLFERLRALFLFTGPLPLRARVPAHAMLDAVRRRPLRRRTLDQ